MFTIKDNFFENVSQPILKAKAQEFLPTSDIFTAESYNYVSHRQYFERYGRSEPGGIVSYLFPKPNTSHPTYINLDISTPDPIMRIQELTACRAITFVNPTTPDPLGTNSNDNAATNSSSTTTPQSM